MWIALLALGAFNIVLGLAVTIIWVRNLRPPKEDPRLSRGLQLLQSKIAVLEDLSDRTDRQVKQLIQILEERARGLQSKLLQAEEMMGKIDQSVAKSLQVADIFQDKIPHEEIIERKNTSKYVQAAKLAHQGLSVDEICSQVGLPKSEVEFIKKVNKDELMFEPEALPDWLSNEKSDVNPQMVEKVFQKTDNDFSNLDRIRQDFKSAVDEERLAQEKVEAIEKRIEEKQKQIVEKAKQFKDNVSKKVVETANASKRMAGTAGELAQGATQAAADAAKPVIKKVRFPKIDPDNFF